MISKFKKVSGTWLFIVVLVILTVAGNAYANTHQTSRAYIEDTDATLKYNGVLWGDWKVAKETVCGLEVVYADGSKIDTLPTNPPWPPYHDSADNEHSLWIDGEWYGLVGGNNFANEVPTTSVRVQRLRVGGTVWIDGTLDLCDPRYRFPQ